MQTVRLGSHQLNTMNMCGMILLERNCSLKVKVKSGTRNGGEGEIVILLEGSQASLACPYDKGNMAVKALRLLEVVA
jgi:hypothetical protein